MTTAVLVGFVLANAFASDSIGLEDAQKILDNLYRASGQFIYEKPALEITKKNERVAAYFPSANKITIDKKALDICAGMGSEAKNALAFLIGHELAHAFQKEVRKEKHPTHFLSYDKHIHGAVRTEKVADIQGVFTGYLAGYGMQKAIPILLEKVYRAYNLMGKDLPNYPSYEERTNSAKEVVKLADELIDLFETTPYLLALEEYSLASLSLEHILEYYQGYEIKNNLGVTYVYSALEFYNGKTDKFSYPLELDASSHLKKLDLARSGGELGYMEKKFRDIALNKALEYFESGLESHQRYTPAKINKACTLNLLEKPKEAMGYLNSNAFSEKEKKSPTYQLIYAITKALLGNQFEALNYFQKLSTNDNTMTAAQGQHNYFILKEKEFEGYPKTAFPLPDNLIASASALTLGSTRQWPSIELHNEENIICKIKKDGKINSFSFGNGFKNIFSLIVSERVSGKGNLFDEHFDISTIFYHNLILSNKYFFLKSSENNVVVKCDLSGRVVAVCKYYKH